MNLDRPIFVVGCFRSGTTLVESILRAHPRVAGPGFETLLMTHLRPRRTLPAFNQEQWRRFLHELGQPEGSFAALARDPLPLFIAAMKALMAREGAERLVEKTPYHLFHSDTLRQEFPSARVVCVLRDGRDVAASILNTPYILPNVRRRLVRLIGGGVLWGWFADEALWLRRRGADVIFVRYEDVAARTDQMLREMDARLDLGTRGEEWAGWRRGIAAIEGNSTFEVMRGISNRGVGRWRQALSDREVGLIEFLLKDRLRVWSYDVERPHRIGVGARIATSALAAAWKLVRLARLHRNAGRWLPPRVLQR